MIAVATKYPNVYIDASAYKCSLYRPELVAYLRGNAGQKVLFGTNHPMLTAQEWLGGLATLGLDTQTQELFLLVELYEYIQGFDPEDLNKMLGALYDFTLQMRQDAALAAERLEQ